MPAPSRPKIYHIVHVDRLPSIIKDGMLWSDAELVELGRPGTVIGMSRIKERRLKELQLSSHHGLFVGQCVPFYFCPRSVMFYLIYRANHEDLSYRDGQGEIIHLESDLRAAVAYARRMNFGGGGTQIRPRNSSGALARPRHRCAAPAMMRGWIAWTPYDF